MKGAGGGGEEPWRSRGGAVEGMPGGLRLNYSIISLS